MTPPSSENETGTREFPDSEISASRRRFLQSAGALSGAIVLGILAEQAEAQVAPAAPIEEPQLVLTMNDNPELGKVGGWKIVDFGKERVIVANTGTGIVACSAICPHKGCEVEYRDADKQFVCPCHNSRFDMEGKVLRGPSRTGLAPYDAKNALIVSARKPA